MFVCARISLEPLMNNMNWIGGGCLKVEGEVYLVSWTDIGLRLCNYLSPV